MPFDLTNTQITVAVVLLCLLIAIAVGVYLKFRKARTVGFKKRFGTEYDRAVLTHGSPQKAEAKLADRETRVETLKIRDLGVSERARFVAEWQTVQSRFVDHPKTAVTEADDLINSLLI